MVATRALGILVNDPQRSHIGLRAADALLALPENADAIGVVSLVDGSALQSRLPGLPAAQPLWRLVGPLKGRCAVVQVRVRDELRPHGPNDTANLGPFRARSFAGAIVGGPQTADEAAATRERLLATVPDFLRRTITGQTEAEVFFVAVLARLHAAGQLDVPVVNGRALADAVRATLQEAGPAPRHVAITNGVEVVHAAHGLPSVLLTLNGLDEEVAAAIDPTLVDSSMGRERLRRFKGVFCGGALSQPVKASQAVPARATLQVLPDSAFVLVGRELNVTLL